MTRLIDYLSPAAYEDVAKNGPRHRAPQLLKKDTVDEAATNDFFRSDKAVRSGDSINTVRLYGGSLERYVRELLIVEFHIKKYR